MKKALKWTGVVAALVIVAAVIYCVHYIQANGPVGTGYTAKILCSSVFVSGREPGDVLDVDLEFVKSYGISAQADREDKTTSASIMGLVKRRAAYRPGLGCTLLLGVTEAEIEEQALRKPKPLPADLAWPHGSMVSDALPAGVDKEKLDSALDWAFSEPDPEHPLRTRAVAVVYNGELIAERYALGFSKDTPLLGWSMTKIVTNAMVGILVKQGRLSVHRPAPVPEWSGPNDPRHEITLDNLLRMNSGLKFQEEYEENPNSDCNVMLFVKKDAAAFAASMPLEAEPGERWQYSSGTTNIISRIIRQAVPGDHRYYLTFPRRELFNRIGMKSAVIEPDPSGTFVGSSFMYATARDWARFGLLYLKDGVWERERILPEGWVEYSTTPTKNTPPGKGYGAQWWLNTGGQDRWMPELPQDIYSARGHEGQYVTVIPSRDTVVVRLGFTVTHKAHWDHQEFLKKVLAALPGPG